MTCLGPGLLGDLFYEVIDRGITQEPGNIPLGTKISGTRADVRAQKKKHRRGDEREVTGLQGKQAQNGKNQKPARDEKGSKPLLPHAFLDVS